jgi:signal transduction histidine kinase
MQLTDLEYPIPTNGIISKGHQALLDKYIADSLQHMDLLREGRIIPVDEVPAEAIMDIGELTVWRRSLAEATGLQTLFYIEENGQRRPAGNSKMQLPVLSAYDKTCSKAMDRILETTNNNAIAHGGICTGCGLPIWISPIKLNHESHKVTIGWLVGHALSAPVRPMQDMVDLVAGRAGDCASEEYSRWVFTALQKGHTDSLLQKAESDRCSMLELEVSANKLAEAKEDLQEALGKADLANKTKSMFLAAMSHEIRTPLTCVVGFADLLSMPGITPERSAEFAHNIKDSGQILMSLINNVLDLSKIEAGRVELEHIDYNLRQLLSEIESTFSMTATEKKLDFIFEISSNVPETQTGDPTRVRQIMMNLVGNALKFTSSGNITVTVEYASENLEITVSDSGFGIPKDQISHIFDPFSQASPETTRKYGGSGLGLAITHSLVESMDGMISVDSTPGIGTTFNLTLPNS